ncbi:Linear gramicidin synthase subunit D [Cytospora mali]|uniref:Linear gramicidin synthase subunit D n=1 Tax=Cytospora mali TaxID=578113 RepID=A0A194VZ67_CYTMA|nr:Linear gramicidin synthase subunit D [Valsa mali]
MSWTTERGLLPNIIKQRRSQTEPFFRFVSPEEGVVEALTFTDIDNASNRAAWFLSKNLAHDEEKFFYMGRMDIRYFVWILAAMKAGKCAVVPSPSNTVAANQLLFSDVGAKTMLFTSEGFEILESLHAATKDTLRWVETPKSEDLFSKDVVEEFPFTCTFDEVKDKQFVGLHTSGTTGHPKPIYWTHSAIPVFGSQVDRTIRPKGLSEVPQFEQLWTGNNVFSHFPWYHAGGMIILISSIIFDTTSLIAAVPGTRLTAENVTAILNATRPEGVVVAPTIAESMLKYQPGLEALTRIKHVVYGGGPMNPVAGAKLAAVLPHLFSILGSTESGMSHLDTEDSSEHWDAFKFIEMGQRMEEVEPGLYELVLPRTEQTYKTHLTFHSYPHLTEYRTKDLFSKVEGQPGWWTFRGRADNWIAMSNGLKFDPKNMEDAIASHPDISAVMLAGERRFRLCLLVELDENCYPAQPFGSGEEEQKWREQALEKLWPTIDEANHKAPKFGRVPKELVYFAKKDKPFTRSPKGGIQRRFTVASYQKEIDEMYAQSEQGILTHDLPPLASTSAEDLLPFVRELYAQTLEHEGFGEDEDAFSQGMDSFAVATLSSRLKAALRAHGTPETKLNQISIRLLYTATTPRKLASVLSSMLSETNGNAVDGDNSEAVEMVEKYEAEVQKLFEQGTQQNGADGYTTDRSAGHVIVVTGTTGSMGSYILATLLARPDVTKVICLNRAADAKERQPKALQSRGLPALRPAIDQGRVVFMTMDVAKPKLGLSEDEYNTLVNEATSIIHNAFPVNFLMTVKQFEPQYVGTLSLLEIAHAGKKSPSFLFISSIGASVRKHTQKALVPEEIFDREEAKDLAMDGYGAAKFICERMTHQFKVLSAKAGRPAAAAVLRVGQISGPLTGTGAWNIWEWLPSIVVSSKYLGVAPATIGQKVDWVPVDQLAKITSDLVDAVEEERSKPEHTPVYNIVNPTATTWQELLPAVKRVAPETVPVGEWLERLDATRDSSTHILDQNPGVKLADFYKGFLTGGETGMNFSTDVLVSASPTAAKLRPVQQQDMERWIETWGL